MVCVCNALNPMQRNRPRYASFKIHVLCYDIVWLCNFVARGRGWRLRVELVSLPCLLHLLDFCGRGKIDEDRSEWFAFLYRADLIDDGHSLRCVLTLQSTLYVTARIYCCPSFLIRILSHQFRLLGQKIPPSSFLRTLPL